MRSPGMGRSVPGPEQGTAAGDDEEEAGDERSERMERNAESGWDTGIERVMGLCRCHQPCPRRHRARRQDRRRGRDSGADRDQRVFCFCSRFFFSVVSANALACSS
jgi:hypothetical protein